MGKRLFDIAFSFSLLLFLSPIFIIIAILIKCDSRGPVFYRGERVGKDGKLFKMYKFRTMREDADKFGGGPSCADDDPRIIKFGKFLRKYKFNELPQLINVLKSEMSFVGPRPEIPEIAALYTEEYKKRLKVKPGITGLAQIKGREDLNKKAIISYDLEYIKNYSILLDLKIIIKTIKVVLSKKGAK